MTRVIEGILTAKGVKFGIVVSRFNDFINKRLLDGALDALSRHGAEDENISIVKVPGSFEIPLMAKKFGVQPPTLSISVLKLPKALQM